jgi:predicted metal-binding protein
MPINQDSAEAKKILKIYNDFLLKIQKIETERDQKINAILKQIDERHLAKIRQEMKK